MKRSAVVFIVLVATMAGACAPKVAPPPPAAGALRYPDFVFPATPDRLGDARTRARLEDAWSRLQAADLEGAESGFGELTRLQPDFYPASVGLGYTLLAQGRPKDALARFDAAAARAPRYGPALAGRAEALLAAGERDAALEAFEAAMAADPGLGDLRRRIDALRLDRLQTRIAAARQAADAGRLDEARDGYAAAIALSPETAFLHRDLGLVELRRKNPREAERHFRKALALDAADVRALAGLGDALEGQGNLDGAISALERALAIEPSDALRQRLDRLRERAQTSGLPPEYAEIPRRAQSTRGDVAALLGVRLQSVLASAASRRSAVATDVRGHWASRWIVEVIRTGVMEVFANHSFQPASIVRRADLAQAASRVLALLGATPGRAERNRVSMTDVAPTHLRYDDIATAVAAGVLSLDGDIFRPSRAVTGQEAVEAVRRLEQVAARSRTGSR
ncbi:MAG: tetratricopeptide repeat protein [Vicinamibacterales bacterium]